MTATEVLAWWPGRRHASAPSIRLRVTVIALCAAALPELAAAQRRADRDTLAAVEADDAFITLEDGQPGAPGEWELQLDVGWLDEPEMGDRLDLHAELQHTPSWNRFFRNTQLQLTIPAAVADGEVELRDPVAAWQQRWVADPGLMLSVATLLEVEIPTAATSTGNDATMTGVLVKGVGTGRAYVNGFLELDEGEGLAQWGVRLGYGLPLGDRAILIGDYVHQEEEGGPAQRILEVAGSYEVSDRLGIGPGLLVGLDRGRDTPRFGAGVRFVVSL